MVQAISQTYHSYCTEWIFCYQLTNVPYSLSTFDGFPIKTAKSTLLHLLESEITHEDSIRVGSRFILDGNALLQSLVKLPPTFQKLAEYIFSILPKAERLDFVTDTYVGGSIKHIESLRRNQSNKILLKGPEMSVPLNWKNFMGNDYNKTQLIKFLLQQWSSSKYASSLKDRRVYFVCQQNCFLLTSTDGLTVSNRSIESLNSTQEEADTRMLLHLTHADRENSESAIIVRSPDTDVFLLLLHYCMDIKSIVLFDTGSGDKRR